MKRLIIAALLLMPLPAKAASGPLNAEQAGRVRCVAALAIIADDQQRGEGGWTDFPPLDRRGARFSDIVADGLIKETDRTREQVRAEVLEQVASFQAGSEEELRETATSCLPMLDAAVPPLKPPTLVQCTAALSLAYTDVKSREGMSKTAKNLAVFSSVVEARARDEMKAAGKTEAESDIAIGLEKERLLAEYKAAGEKGTQDTIDFRACFDMARP